MSSTPNTKDSSDAQDHEAGESVSTAGNASNVNTAVVGWGYNAVGQVGTGTILNRRVKIPAFLPVPEEIRSISVGNAHSAAISNTGHLLMWGGNHWGQLGLGDVLNRGAPTSVTAFTDRVTFVACGGDYTVCSLSDGQTFSWGCNTRGQLGLGKVSDYANAVPKPVGKIVARYIACGASHTMILDDRGCLHACGWNVYGQLGLNHQRQSPNLSKVNLENVIKVACGRHHTLALLSDGCVYSWGAVLTCFTEAGLTIVDIAAGFYHSLCLDAAGTAWAFGFGGDGALGTSQSAPPNASATRGVGGIGGGADTPDQLHSVPLRVNITPFEHATPILVRAVFAGGWHSAIVSESGAAFLFGWTESGRLGDGNENAGSDLDGGDGCRPRQPVFPDESVRCVTVACGAAHTVAIIRIAKR